MTSLTVCSYNIFTHMQKHVHNASCMKKKIFIISSLTSFCTAVRKKHLSKIFFVSFEAKHYYSNCNNIL